LGAVGSLEYRAVFGLYEGRVYIWASRSIDIACKLFDHILNLSDTLSVVQNGDAGRFLAVNEPKMSVLDRSKLVRTISITNLPELNVLSVDGCNRRRQLFTQLLPENRTRWP
jgi:hypothetical protein